MQLILSTILVSQLVAALFWGNPGQPNLLLNKRDGKSNSTESSKTTSKTSVTSVNPNLPAGSLALTTPVSTSTTYVKSGELVTFGWNFTNLILSPSAINVEVICTQNKETYTIAHNQSIQTSSVVWDTNKATGSGGLHLISAEYTLTVYDASKSSRSVARAGELSPFQYSFGLYIPQKYTPWAPAAKYVNFAIKLNSPEIMTICLTTSALGIFLIM